MRFEKLRSGSHGFTRLIIAWNWENPSFFSINILCGPQCHDIKMIIFFLQDYQMKNLILSNYESLFWGIIIKKNLHPNQELSRANLWTLKQVFNDILSFQSKLSWSFKMPIKLFKIILLVWFMTFWMAIINVTNPCFENATRQVFQNNIIVPFSCVDCFHYLSSFCLVLYFVFKCDWFFTLHKYFFNYDIKHPIRFINYDQIWGISTLAFSLVFLSSISNVSPYVTFHSYQKGYI